MKPHRRVRWHNSRLQRDGAIAPQLNRKDVSQKTMMLKDAIHTLVTKIQQTGDEKPKAATAEELKRAGEAGFPADLIEFYRDCNPDDCVELKQRIWSIDNALVENQDAVPGCYLFPPFSPVIYAAILIVSTRMLRGMKAIIQ